MGRVVSVFSCCREMMMHCSESCCSHQVEQSLLTVTESLQLLFLCSRFGLNTSTALSMQRDSSACCSSKFHTLVLHDLYLITGKMRREAWGTPEQILDPGNTP